MKLPFISLSLVGCAPLVSSSLRGNGSYVLHDQLPAKQTSELSRALAPKAKSPKESKKMFDLCGGIEPTYCDAKKSKIFICHYDEALDEFETICVSEKTAKSHVKQHGEDRCGLCEEVALRLIESLDSMESPEQAFEELASEDLKMLVQLLNDALPEALTGVITESIFLQAMFPQELSVEEQGNNGGHRELIFGVSLGDCEPEIIALAASSIWLVVSCIAPYTQIKALLKPAAAVTASMVGGQVVTKASSNAFSFIDDFEVALANKDPVQIAWKGFQVFRLLLKVTGAKVVFKVFFTEITKGLSSMSRWDTAKLAVELLAGFVAVFAMAADLPALALVVSAIILTLKTDTFIDDIRDLFNCLEEDTEDCDPSTKPECVTADLCTVDTLTCNEATAYIWQCTHSPKECSESTSCDPQDGQCKLDDQLIPCVAVIDEDTEFGYGGPQEAMWSQFRALYPSRPFCLLIPEPKPFQSDIVHIPESFLNDDTTIVWDGIVRRDNGDASLVEDWAHLCGLDLFSPGNVRFVGLFIDNSGSLYESEVGASKELFLSRMEAKGIQVKTVVNEDENWIEPFMTTLVDAPACIVAGVPGKCIDRTACMDQANFPIASLPENPLPEPNCHSLPVNIQCCITAPTCIASNGLQGLCLDQAACQGMGVEYTLYPYQQGNPDPNCKLFPDRIQCCAPDYL